MFESIVVPFFMVLGCWLLLGVVGLFVVVEVSRLLEPWAERRLRRELPPFEFFDWAVAEREFEDVA